MSRIILLLAIAGSLLIFSCKTRPRAHSAEEKKYYLAVRPPAGSRYYYNIQSETRSQIEYESKKIDKANKVDLSFTYDILKDTADSIVLKITYDRLKITGSDPSQDANLLSEALKGDSLIILVKADGNVISIEGNKETADKILAAAKINDPYIKKVFKDQMSQLAGEDFIKYTVQQTFKIFPDSAVYIGDSWSLRKQWPGLIKSVGLTEYTLKAVEKGIATVDAHTQMNSGTDAPANILGYDVQPDIKVRQNATFSTDVSTGMILNGQSTISVEGTISMMGRQVPLKMKMDRTLQKRN